MLAAPDKLQSGVWAGLGLGCFKCATITKNINKQQQWQQQQHGKIIHANERQLRHLLRGIFISRIRRVCPGDVWQAISAQIQARSECWQAGAGGGEGVKLTALTYEVVNLKKEKCES